MFLVIDQIIGCGERSGKKYFLVRFKGERENVLIEWEEAKKYAVEVMEFFGKRLVWQSVDAVIDPENVNVDTVGINDLDQRDQPSTSRANQPDGSTSPVNKIHAPNDIEYAD